MHISSNFVQQNKWLLENKPWSTHMSRVANPDRNRPRYSGYEETVLYFHQLCAVKSSFTYDLWIGL